MFYRKSVRSYLIKTVGVCFIFIQWTQGEAMAELVAHWPLNEGSGDVFEDVAGDNDGYLPIAEFEEETEIEWGNGPPTQEHAVEFLGINSFIATDFPGIEGDNPRTVTFWFQTEDDSAYFLAWGANATSEKWHIRLNGGQGTIRTEYQGGQNFATTNLIDGEWHHIASVFPNGAAEGGEILHYVDGELDDFGGGTSIPIDTAITDDEVDWADANSLDPYTVHFGGVLAHGFNRMLEGSMADIRIYDEGLSQERIQAIMDGSDPGGVNNNPCDFDGDGTLGLGDVDLLLAELAGGGNDASFDINGDGNVDQTDLTLLIGDENKLHTWIGDTNLDGEFNSSDFVRVFQEGLFETGSPAGWTQGDWNGDGVFSSSDFVAAFQDGGFELGPKWPVDAVAGVPEPCSHIFVLCGVLGLIRFRRR